MAMAAISAALAIFALSCEITFSETRLHARSDWEGSPMCAHSHTPHICYNTPETYRRVLRDGLYKLQSYKLYLSGFPRPRPR